MAERRYFTIHGRGYWFTKNQLATEMGAPWDGREELWESGGRKSPTDYQCPDCGWETTTRAWRVRCSNCGSLNLERRLADGTWWKADAQEPEETEPDEESGYQPSVGDSFLI